MSGTTVSIAIDGLTVVKSKVISALTLIMLDDGSSKTWWKLDVNEEGENVLRECQYVTVSSDGARVINGSPSSPDNQLRQVGTMERIDGKSGDVRTGPLGPFKYLATIGSRDSVVRMWRNAKFKDGTDEVTVYYPVLENGAKVMRPGLKFKVEGTPIERIDFLSLMLALFLGTAALPHILIRYYTVPSPKDARKSTIIMAIILGIIFKRTNVSFLVGLAFAVAASANLPSIVMMLFWKKTTSIGITASIFTGIISSVGIILVSPTMYEQYGLDPATALIPLRNPGVISIPLSFLVILVVSLLTQKNKAAVADTVVPQV